MWLCRERKTGKVVALKKLKKSEMVRRGQVDHVKAERNVLAEVHNPYIVRLYYSFQVCPALSAALRSSRRARVHGVQRHHACKNATLRANPRAWMLLRWRLGNGRKDEHSFGLACFPPPADARC